MNTVEEVKKKYQCQNCDQFYRYHDRKFTFNQCAHHVCYMCRPHHYQERQAMCKAELRRSVVLKFRKSEDGNWKVWAHNSPEDENSIGASNNINAELRYADCPVCDSRSEMKKSTFRNEQKELFTLLDSFVEKEDDKDEIQKKMMFLGNNNPKENLQKCSDCGGHETEQNMQLCANCTDCKFDMENIMKNMLCAGCAIKKHIRQEHKTVDFYPYLRAHNFSALSTAFKSDSTALKDAKDLLNATVSSFNELSNTVSENSDALTDMAQRSKSTKKQAEFFEHMKRFLRASRLVHINADRELKRNSNILREHLNNLRNWYNEEMKECVDESELVDLELQEKKPSIETKKVNQRPTRKRRQE